MTITAAQVQAWDAEVSALRAALASERTKVQALTAQLERMKAERDMCDPVVGGH